MDIDSEMTISEGHTAGRNGNDNRGASFGRVCNEAALAFVQSYEAQENLRDAKYEAERQRGSFQAFPANRQRFEQKLSSARRKEADAKAKVKEKTDRLDDSILDIIQRLAKNEFATIVEGAVFQDAVRAAISTDDRLGHGKNEGVALSKNGSKVIKEELDAQRRWMEEQTAQFEKRLKLSENQYRERLEASEMAMKNKLDHVVEEQKGIKSTMEEISTSNTQLLQRVDELERNMRALVDISRLQMQDYAVEKRDYVEHPVSVNDSVPMLAEAIENIRLRSLKNRDALKNSEALFNKLFDAVDHLDEKSGVLEDDLAEFRTSRAEGKTTNTTSSTAPENRAITDERLLEWENQVNNRIDDKVDTMHEVLETMMNNLTTDVNDKVKYVTSNAARIEDVTKLESILRTELERVVADSVNKTVISGIDATITQLNDRFDTRFSAHDEQCSRLDKEVQGAQIAVKHLTRRLDKHSADEIVGKINMNLRNVNLSQLSKVQANVNMLAHNLRLLTEEMNSMKATNGLNSPMTRNGNT